MRLMSYCATAMSGGEERGDSADPGDDLRVRRCDGDSNGAGA